MRNMGGGGHGGRGVGGFGAGPSGNCVCPNCGTRVAHQRGKSCFSMTCPKCGTAMVREGTVGVNPAGVDSRPQRRIPRVDESKCTGCQNCVSVCPSHAITVENGTARISRERCAGCLACIRACPVGAIAP